MSFLSSVRKSVVYLVASSTLGKDRRLGRYSLLKSADL